MLDPRLIESELIPSQTWRNGCGRTRELLAWPDRMDWRLRVSVAEVDTAAPFSVFPGVERWFAVIQGAGVELRIDGSPQRQSVADAPLRFSGEATVDCKPVDGPTRDLNLMLRGICGGMRLAEGGIVWAPARSSQCGLFTSVAGRCRSDQREIELPAHALLWFDDAPTELTFPPWEPQAQVPGWWIEAVTTGGST